MPALSIIRAWKDLAYRRSLSAAERALLPDHPAGTIELTEAELDAAAGGTGLVVTDDCAFTGEIACPVPP
jgi:mersacidin/lichenicidin family type 2 lantibiotic